MHARRSDSAARRPTLSMRAAFAFVVAAAGLAQPACEATVIAPMGVLNDQVLVAEDAVWTALVNVTANGSSLRKTGGVNQVDDAGAVSKQQLFGDGYMEFTASEVATYRCIGLSHGNPGTTCGEINFAFRLQAGVAEVRENGAWKTDTRFVMGDVLRIAVTGNQVVYLKNGAVVYTSGAKPVWPLLVDTSLIDAGATITSVRIGLPMVLPNGGGAAPDAGAACPPEQDVIWTALVNVTATGDSLRKTGGVNQLDDAGAISTQQIAAGDGYVQFVASEPATYRCLGLSNGNPGTTCGEIAFAFRLQAGSAEVREHGVWRVSTPFATGDVLRIGVQSGVVGYYKNGALVYASRLSPSYPLLVDTALIDAGATLTNVHIATATNPAGPAAADAGVAMPPPVQMGATHHRCGWLMVTDPAGKASFLANASWFNAIHPDWYRINSDGIGVTPILAADDAAVLAAAGQNNVAVIPMVASVDNVAYTRTMLYAPANRAAHIKALVALAVSHNYAGLDLDYEHLWDKADGAPLAAFIQEFAAAMHAAGKQASMAVAGLDTGSSVSWSYAAVAANLDQAHVMGYDFHTIGTHAGPTAPLGWVDRVMAQAQATGHPERFILGLPNYGVTASSACALSDCAAQCTSAISTSSPHMLSCPFGADATPERILNCNSNAGALFFDDTASLEQKVARAKARGIGGITYWNVGSEPAGFFAMVKGYY